MSLEPEALLEHAAFVRSVARATLRGDDLADDVVQDTMIAAIEESHRRRGPLRAWLAGVARNKAHNLIRRRAAGRRREERAARTERTRGVDDVAERAEEGRRLVAAVLGLEERYREPILLRYYEGLPPREIARRLDMPVETVRTRIKRGVARLRAELERTHERRPGGWQAALLPLLSAPPRGSGTTPYLLTGGAMLGKKGIVWAALLLVLVGGGLWLRPWDDKADTASTPGDAMLASDSEDASEPRLDGLASKTSGDSKTGLAPVDFSKVDRDRDLHGIVVRADGTPVSGASVVALRYRWKLLGVISSIEQLIESAEGPQAVTARDGSFKLPLERGDLVNLRVRSRGLASLELPNLQAGERVRVVLPEGVRLVVRVTAPGGKSVQGVPVRLRANADREGHYLWAVETTGPDGRAVFEGLPPGLHLSLRTEPNMVGLAAPGGERLELPAEGELLHAVELVPGLTLRGRVLEARTMDPIPHARVGTNVAFIPSVLTNADGEWVLNDWREAQVEKLHADAPGFVHGTFAVTAGAEMDLVLGRAVTLHGRVVKEDGEAVPGALVGLQHPERGQPSTYSWGGSVTDADGRFEVGGLALSAHAIVVHHPGFGRLVQWVHAPTGPNDLDLGDLVLRAPCVVAGRLTDEAGAPIARLQVTLTPQEDLEGTVRRSERWTDDLGRFRFPDLGPGTYEVKVGPRFDPTIRKTVQVTEEQPTVDLTLTPEGVRSVVVRAVDKAGAPAVGVYFQAQALEAKYLKRDTTGEDGLVTLELLHRPYELVVLQTVGLGFALPPPIQLDASQTRVDVVLERLMAIRGRLLTPEGKPIAWGAIRVDGDNKTTQGVHSNEEGAFTVYVRAGVRVSLSFEGTVQNSMQRLHAFVPYTALLEDVAAGTEGLVLRTTPLDTRRELTLRLLDPSGTPVANTGLQIHLRANEYRQVVTDDAGRAHWKDLPALPLRPMLSLWSATREKPWIKPTFETVTPEGQEITAKFRAGPFVEGTVLKADGSPAAWAGMQILENEKYVGHAQADAEGRFVAVLDPEWKGKLTLRCNPMGPSGQRFLAVAEDVRPGQDPITLQLELVEK